MVVDGHLDVKLQPTFGETWKDAGMASLSQSDKASIESVRILSNRGWMPRMTDADLIRLFQALSRRLPNLARLRLKLRGTPMPVTCLTEVLSSGQQLVSLRLFDVQWNTGSSSAVQALAYQVERQSCLMARVEEVGNLDDIDEDEAIHD